MITNSIALGVPDVVRPRDIVTGNEKVNTLFVSYIFNTKHGLEELTADEYQAAAMLDDDIEGTREERVFRLWINSLNIEDVYVNNLFDDIKDGVLINKVIHKIDDKVVDWPKVDLQPNNDFKRNINNNTAIEACKKLKLKMIGVGGVDLTKGDKKLVLAVVWQIMRLSYLKVIGDKTEEDLVKWANESVGGKHTSIENLRDKSLADSKFLIHLLSSIEPRAVNWDLVQAGETDEEKQNNAKYAISIARKLGAVMFCVWEDLVHVNPKQLLIFVSTCLDIQQH
jgi:plastin-1